MPSNNNSDAENIIIWFYVDLVLIIGNKNNDSHCSIKIPTSKSKFKYEWVKKFWFKNFWNSEIITVKNISIIIGFQVFAQTIKINIKLKPKINKLLKFWMFQI